MAQYNRDQWYKRYDGWGNITFSKQT